ERRAARAGWGPSNRLLGCLGVVDDVIHAYGLRLKTLPLQVPSRYCPPSMAARLAANAPKNSDAVSHSAACAAALRARSAAALASVTTSLTRFCASAWFSPVRAETSFAT